MNLRSITKLIGVVCIMFLILPHVVIASEGTQNVTEFRFTARFSEADLSFDELMGYDVVRLKDASTINEIGNPVMPAKEVKVALPRGMEATSIQVIATQKVDIEGEYYIFPAQPPIIISAKPDGFVQPNLDIYNSMEPYPENLVEFVHQTDLAGQGMAVIQINPVRYIPGEKKLILYTMISVTIEGKGGYVCGDYLPENISEHNSAKYEQMIKDMVINPEDVQLNTDPAGGTGSFGLPPGGPYDHVIITSSSYESYWAPLVEWRTKHGLKSTVVTTNYIYSNYAGSDNQERIRNFIIDAHGTWGTEYFLMGGEHGTVPFEYYTYYQQNTPSDQYYSDYDGDWIHEVYVGRSTAEGSSQIDLFIDKVLYYERTPPTSNYPLDVLLIGMDLTEPPDPPTPAEDLKETIDGYIPARFNVTKVYDSHTGDHEVNTINALNAGQNLVNHADHSSEEYMGTGYLNHGWGIYNYDVNGLTNNYEMSIVVSLGCEPNAMDHSECIAERFVIYNSYQAGVAFTGNTRHGWGWVGNPDGLSGRLDRDWWRGLFYYSQNKLGDAIIWSKHQFSTGGSYPDLKKHCEWTFNLLGEPAMPIWTATPGNLIVTHSNKIPLCEQEFIVKVEETDGDDVEDAVVCLWKGTDIYEVEMTNSEGEVHFSLNPTTNGIMYVTVTKYDYNDNYLPYEGQTEVTSHADYCLNLDDFPMYEAEAQYNQKSGAAVAQMAVNYMHWNSNTHPGGPPMTYTQSELYTYGDDFSGVSPYFDMEAVWHCVQDGPYRPLPYSEYGYNFTKKSGDNQNDMMKQICLWIDYPAGKYPNHPVHVPAIVPAYGDYTNWIAVRGIHTDVEAYPLPPTLNMYGFWVNDPYPTHLGGIGENSYKTASEFSGTYYLYIDVPGDPYDGKYLAVLEPPESTEGCELIIPEPIPRFTPAQMELLGNVDGQTILQEDENQWIIDAAIAGVTEELIPYDENFAAVFENTVPGSPMYATSFNNDDYYLVPFNAGKLKKVRNKSVPADAKTTVVILINAQDGSFKEASWTEDVTKYLPLSKTEAQQIAFETAEDYGLEVEEINDLKPELIHRQSSPYYPEWLVIIGEYGIFISQDGTVSIEEYSGLGSGPGGPQSEDTGSVLTYGLNTALPTPFIKTTMISYSIARSGYVSLDIYDVCGRLVKTLVNTHMDAGVYNLQWNGYDNNNQRIPPGVYFTRLASGEFVSVKKTILAR